MFNSARNSKIKFWQEMAVTPPFFHKSNYYAKFQCCNSYFDGVPFLVLKRGTSAPPPNYLYFLCKLIPILFRKILLTISIHTCNITHIRLKLISGTTRKNYFEANKIMAKINKLIWRKLHKVSEVSKGYFHKCNWIRLTNYLSIPIFYISFKQWFNFLAHTVFKVLLSSKEKFVKI